MAVRVRKLVKESRRSALEIIGVLHALGFERYRSLDDMLPDPVVLRVERAWKQGVRPVVLPPDLVAALQRSVSGPVPADGLGPAAGASVMDKLVPGVSALDAPQAVSARPVLAPAAPVGQPTSRPGMPASPRLASAGPASVAPVVPPPGVAQASESALAQLEAARLQLEASRAQLEEARAKLEAEREALAAEREVLAAERQRIAEERSAVVAERATLASERAVMAVERAALSEARAALAMQGSRSDSRDRDASDGRAAGAQAMGATANREPAAPSAEASGGPAVRSLMRLGESLLLNGLRRLVVIGGDAAGQQLVREHLDPRVDIRFLPASTRRRQDAESDVMRTDIVVLWGCDADSDALGVYRTARAMLVHTRETDVEAMVTALEAALHA